MRLWSAAINWKWTDKFLFVCFIKCYYCYLLCSWSSIFSELLMKCCKNPSCPILTLITSCSFSHPPLIQGINQRESAHFMQWQFFYETTSSAVWNNCSRNKYLSQTSCILLPLHKQKNMLWSNLHCSICQLQNNNNIWWAKTQPSGEKTEDPAYWMLLTSWGQ